MSDLTTGSLPTIQATVTDQTGAAIDLTGATVKLRYTLSGSAVVVATATVTDGPGGVAEYTMPEITTAGPFVREWEIDTGQVIRSADKYYSRVRSALV